MKSAKVIGRIDLATCRSRKACNARKNMEIIDNPLSIHGMIRINMCKKEHKTYAYEVKCG